MDLNLNDFDTVTVDRLLFKNLINIKFLNGNLSYKSGSDMLILFDFLFSEKNEFYLNRDIFKILFILGLISLDDYMSNVFKITPEILIIIKLLNKKNNQNFKEIIKNIN